jgi:hypothetical protein
VPCFSWLEGKLYYIMKIFIHFSHGLSIFPSKTIFLGNLTEFRMTKTTQNFNISHTL